MHILFISQYFHPEIGAASERISGFARNLSGFGHKITVITGFPNYPFDKKYPGYKKKLFSVEKYNGVKVIRVWLFTTGSAGVAARLLNYFSFMITSIAAGLRVRDLDFVFATSGPIFAGLAGYILSRTKKVPFIFDVRDIWPERIYAGTDMKRGFATKMLEKLEMILYAKAVKIIAVTKGVKANIVSKGVSAEKVNVITNGVDTNIFATLPLNHALVETLGIGQNKFTVIYAGTLGLFQDIDLIVECAERLRNYEDILFLIVGGGARRDEFCEKVERRELINVIMVPPVSSTELNNYINLSDIGINANTDHPHNDMAIPVKMFPYMACAKPVVLANTGEIAEIVAENNVGECVPPGDIEAFSSAILKLYQNRELCRQCGENGYKLVIDKFSSDMLARQLEKSFLV
jgi:glycosyltransferase involved in cell wall biosynthesis